MIGIILSNNKKKILKDIAFFILNRSDEHTFHCNMEKWQVYIMNITDTQLKN